MKVLFAVNNENISESIIKRYQQDYKEIISAKNVYYFNAIIKELQKDKTYDRIIISEDLEPFSNNNYDTIDKFIFEKLDRISDEATNQSGNDIPIILICADRRAKSEAFLVKLFGIGVYNALIGKDRSITSVCELLNRPRGKKEAKAYYRIDSEDVDYKIENESDVSEVEIQNILNHYKKLGKNEEKYVESFEHIASQYTDNQLRLIAKFLPLNVKAVLEANSKTYQEIVSFGSGNSTKQVQKYNNYQKNSKEFKVNSKQINKLEKKQDLDFMSKNLGENKINEPIVIPSAIDTTKIRKISSNAKAVEEKNIEELPQIEENHEEILVVEPKRRGRPKKIKIEEKTNNENEIETKKRGRGRPKKTAEVIQEPQVEIEEKPQASLQNAPLNLFELGEEEEDINNEEQNDININSYSDIVLPGLEDDEKEENDNIINENVTTVNSEKKSEIDNYFLQNVEHTSNTDLSGLLTRDKKVVAFVGTSKNGTSFLVNNLAELLSQKGIKTAILDLTKNKNAYYIYTKNEENLRNIAYKTYENLINGNAEGITVNKNLDVYTTIPEIKHEDNDYVKVLETLLKNYSLILLDCDFETPYEYFEEAQEIYLVQTMDILTIQPLTAFLRNLKAKNVLKPEKIRVVLNKMLKVRSLTEKTIIGGISYYNDPGMSFMTELFDKDSVKYCSIPFEEQTYSKYLEGLVNCKINLNGYSKNFIIALTNLSNMVYPLIEGGKISNKKQYNDYASKNTKFSSSINDTLNKMKNNY